MKTDILFCKDNQIDGVVFGILNAAHEIDMPACKTLIELARPMSVTFHRAIDQCHDLKQSFTQLIELGVDRVLTSGRAASALEGLPQLAILQKIFGNKISIMPGGGLRAEHLKAVIASGCREYHSSAITSGSEMADAEEIKALSEILKSTIL